jgi:membrane protein YqaA with SNARE-associated domain
MTEQLVSKPRGPLRRLYAWVMSMANHGHAWTAMAFIAFAESSFLPFPPDLLLVPMVLANRRKAFLICGWCTLWSVLGGALGYTIGALLYDSVGKWLIEVYGMAGGIEAFRIAFHKCGYWIMAQGLTPIPYKLVTIASGFAGFNFWLFMLFSTITRGVRFTGEAILLYIFGEKVQVLIEKYLPWVLIAFFTLVIGGMLAARYLFAGDTSGFCAAS